MLKLKDPTVTEAIEDRRNGLLVDFFNARKIAQWVTDALEPRDETPNAGIRWTAYNMYHECRRRGRVPVSDERACAGCAAADNRACALHAAN